MNLIILTDQDQFNDTHYRLTDHRAEHIRTILKLEVGDHLEIGLLNGPLGMGVIEKVGSSEVIISPRLMHEAPVSAFEVDLICALPRPQTLKKVLFTCAMMGVRRLDLIRANRVERSYYQSPLLQPDNYTPFLIEGLSQGKLTRLPEVAIHHRFRPFFEDTLPNREGSGAGCGAKILPDPEAQRTMPDVLIAKEGHLWLAIGPEGGWVPFEVDLMKQIGFQAVTLGRWVLRVEHAITAALAQIELIKMPTGDQS
ncbi:MAG: RsmE family RNA methyltransferase [bacterium]